MLCFERNSVKYGLHEDSDDSGKATDETSSQRSLSYIVPAGRPREPNESSFGAEYGDERQKRSYLKAIA